jgi:hypothetical protein
MPSSSDGLTDRAEASRRTPSGLADTAQVQVSLNQVKSSCLDQLIECPVKLLIGCTARRITGEGSSKQDGRRESQGVGHPAH